MSNIPRYVNLAVPDSDGEPVFVDYVRKDIADDLLDALEYMLNACPAIDPCGEDARDKARAAIAKAKGEQR